MTDLLAAKHILVVDDDDRLRALLHDYLQEQGYFVSTAADTKQADALLHVFAVDAMVLDVMMPGENGLDYAARLRPRADAPPLLLLTARSETDDRIAGLEAGAADYLGKPFAPRELLLRLENMIQRAQPVTAPPATTNRAVLFGDYRFDMGSNRLSKGEEIIYLTSSESDCLKILAQSAGSVVSREAMAASLGEFNNARSIDVQINRLRKKFEPLPGKPRYLQTIRHAGYVLYAETV